MEHFEVMKYMELSVMGYWRWTSHVIV